MRYIWFLNKNKYAENMDLLNISIKCVLNILIRIYYKQSSIDDESIRYGHSSRHCSCNQVSECYKAQYIRRDVPHWKFIKNVTRP